MTDSELIRYTAQAMRLFVNAYFPGQLAYPTAASAAPPMPKPLHQFATGITIEGGAVTDRPHHLTARVGETVQWTGGPAKVGMAADDRDSWGAGLPYHVADPLALPSGSSFTFRAGDALTIAVPMAAGGGLEEAVLITEESMYPPAPPLAAVSRTLTGMTTADVAAFLASTDWWPETAEGWQARAGRARINFGISSEQGYGGKVAERTSFGVLLLHSDLPPDQRLLVQTRLLKMSQDAEHFNCNYPGDGGHGNGRYAPWLLRSNMGFGSRLLSSGFSEAQQVVPYTGLGNLAGYGWRHRVSNPVDMTSNYVTCCTANRWAGAALLLGGSGQWATYTAAYLRWRESLGWNDWAVMHGRSREIILSNRAVLGW